MSLAPVFVASFHRLAPKLNDARQVANVYVNGIDGGTLPDSFPNDFMLPSDEDTVKSTLAAPLFSVLVHPDPVRPDFGEWGCMFYGAFFFWQLSLS